MNFSNYYEILIPDTRTCANVLQRAERLSERNDAFNFSLIFMQSHISVHIYMNIEILLSFIRLFNVRNMCVIQCKNKVFITLIAVFYAVSHILQNI